MYNDPYLSPKTARKWPDFEPQGPILHELFANPGDGSFCGFALAQIAARTKPALLWVQEYHALREAGRPFLHGMPAALRDSFIHVVTRDTKQTLWAMEEGLKCPSLSAVIGEVHGDARALDFTATRRLAVAAERYGVSAFLVRIGGHADLSGARRRWRVASRPSLTHPLDAHAPGRPAWSLDLFRARDLRPGSWDAAYDAAAHRLDLVPATGDEPVVQGASQAG
ncbi:hypothetical protein HFP51_08950 [Parasphingopyxis sp. CP4]|uniref:ImuA family protein n=1 Tax=Parasphingopyxis sp. CP4 TaxID=2724527 RepID=UPI00159F736B|nr:hypothetical protein [Parasphingopyxis sp. CP4]QLC22293.1 hypothetical protein HFP51_08950 [Parasphingopyxis sp. CP4]